ncbi:MAG: glycosyltransferase family 4 protein, partial [Candidatus Omnitrophica bacterium]|nr:glycosyltransferase family 4 protein [Candidatus Omnitrophota bacterium]
SAIAQSKFGFLKFFLMFKICQIKNIPYIIHLHGNMLPITFKTNKRLFQKMILDVLNKSNKVIVLSETLKKQVFFDVSKVEIINNFVEDDFFISYDNKKAILEDSTFKLFYLSNLIESKGILDVLRACLLLKDRGIKFHLTIAGLWQKEIKRKGQKIVKELGEEYVTYLGVVQGERKKEVIHKDHIFLLPTYYPQEGVPISILEAMAGGNVILTTRQGGIADIITEGKNGYFVEKKNPKGITDKICFLYQNFPKIKQISQNNIEYAKEFTVKQFVNSIETLIKSAVVENKHEQ